MKLLTFRDENGLHTGALNTEGHVLDLAAAAKPHEEFLFTSMLDLIANEDRALDVATRLLANDDGSHVRGIDGIQFEAPVPVPNSIRDFANFELHCLQALEASMRLRASMTPDPEASYQAFKASGAYNLPPSWYERPYYFKGNRMSCSGHDSEILWPTFTKTMDYEVEVAAVIGKGGVNIAEEHAREAIFGYTVYNDFSARDEQTRDQQFRMGPSKGKDFDTGNAFGPWIITRDEFIDPYNAKMTSRINGVTQGTGVLGDMQHRFEACIAFISRDETLYAGDILGSGTMGNGCGFETGQYLNPGDIIELEVEGIGVLRNRIGSPRS